MESRGGIILAVCICFWSTFGCHRSRPLRQQSESTGSLEPIEEVVEVLPDCNELYKRYFAPLYSRDQWASHPFQTVRPDIEKVAAPGTPVSELQTLSNDARQTVSEEISNFVRTAKLEWPNTLGIETDASLGQMISGFDEYYDRPAIREVISRSDPTRTDNDYVRLCSQFGAVLGVAFQERRPTMNWVYAEPYLSSALVDEPSGIRVNVFDWAEKKMSEYGVDDGYTAKMDACENVLRKTASQLSGPFPSSTESTTNSLSIPSLPGWVGESQTAPTASATFFRTSTRCGPLQVSLRTSVNGAPQDFTGGKLQQMAAEFGERSFGCGPAREQSHGECAVGMLGTAIFSAPPDRCHGQVWFLSNGRDVVLATHRSAGPPDPEEVAEANQIVRQIAIVEH